MLARRSSSDFLACNAEDDPRRVYDLLWDLAKEPGAVSTATLLLDEWRLRPFQREPIELRPTQSAVLRKAVELVKPKASALAPPASASSP